MASVLHIEDDETWRLEVKKRLETYGIHTVMGAATLDVAQKLPTRKWDVVLLDLTIPGSSGLDTVRRAMAIFHESAVVVLTVASRELGIEAARLGMDTWCSKSEKFDWEGLSSTISEAKARLGSPRIREVLTSAKLERFVESLSDTAPMLLDAAQKSAESARLHAEATRDLANTVSGMQVCPLQGKDPDEISSVIMSPPTELSEPREGPVARGAAVVLSSPKVWAAIFSGAGVVLAATALALAKFLGWV